MSWAIAEHRGALAFGPPTTPVQPGRAAGYDGLVQESAIFQVDYMDRSAILVVLNWLLNTAKWNIKYQSGFSPNSPGVTPACPLAYTIHWLAIGCDDLRTWLGTASRCRGARENDESDTVDDGDPGRVLVRTGRPWISALRFQSRERRSGWGRRNLIGRRAVARQFSGAHVPAQLPLLLRSAGCRTADSARTRRDVDAAWASVARVEWRRAHALRAVRDLPNTLGGRERTDRHTARLR